METKNMIGGIVSLAVVVICVAAIMMPVIQDAQESSGDAGVATNTGYTYLSAAPNPTTIVYDYDTTTFTINDEEQSKTASALYILSDNFTLRTTSGSGNILYLTTTSTESTGNFDFEITYDGSSLVMTKTSTSTEIVNVTATWMYISETDGDYSTRVSTNTVYYTDDTQLLVRGYYSTGELDTTYWITPDDAGTGEGYTISYSFEGTLEDGTYDLYTGTPVITISDGTTTETFTPYNYAVDKEVDYTNKSGAAYSLYGAIPIIVIAAIVVASIGMVVTRRD